MDGRFALKSFANISEAVERYFFNLNTHPAYREFRETRAKLRKDGHSLNSIYLAQHLIRYSERKGHYVQDIVEMIMDNDLRLFDRAVLVEMSPAERQSLTLTNYLADTEVDDPKSAGHRKDRA